ncbi:hypothetical protein [Celeribacter sp.]|uniref:hypothetical protein n=1 Tax=Celeribacter sp. TaxID=1890673 RepID=UPI003A92E3B8
MKKDQRDIQRKLRILRYAEFRWGDETQCRLQGLNTWCGIASFLCVGYPWLTGNALRCEDIPFGLICGRNALWHSWD